MELVRESWRRSWAAWLAAAASLLVPLAAAAAGSSAARLAFVGTDDNIYECGGDCVRQRCVTCPVHGTETRGAGARPVAFEQPQDDGATKFAWPTYSPDGRKLACLSSGGKQGRPAYGVYVYDLDKMISTRIFESSTERGIYLFWLPGGQRLSFLVTEPDDRLTLMLAEARGDEPIRIVASGAPLYFDWNRKNELLLHTTVTGPGGAERVSLMNVTPTSQDVERVLSRGNSPFKTPCWSPDGAHLAFVASEDDIAHLYLADRDGRNPRAMTKLMVGESSFVWAPDSRHIAFATAQLPPHTVMDGVNLLDVADGSVMRLVNDDVAAFYFSPDSRRIAYATVPPEQPFYTWNVIDLRTGKSRQLGSFLTTNEETLAWHYFDQLALSHSIWAPDSSAIAFAGLPIEKPLHGAMPEQPPEQPIDTPPPGVMILPIDGGKPRRVADGVLAFWAPVAVPNAPAATAP